MITGHLRKRQTKNGKTSYQIILETERDPMTGQRQRRYQTVNGTKKEAEAMLAKLKVELMNGEIAKTSSIKLEDWLEEWQRLYIAHLSPTTKQGYRQQIEHRIIPCLGKTPINMLKTSDIQAWVNTLSYTDGLSGQTVKNIFLNLSAALEKARKLKMIPENPCVDVVLPHIKKYEAQVYNAEKVKEVLELAKGTDMYLILVIGFYLGLRKGEVAALKWSDIDLANGIVHIRESRVRVDNNVITKSPKSAAGIRDLWLGKEACDVFREEYARYLESSKVHGFSKQGYVVCRLDGEPFAPDSIPQKWERFREAHNLPKIRFHDLRHTCATLMLANGVDAKTAQTRLGHSNIQITLNTYAHCLPAMNKAAGDKLDSILVNK